MQLEIYKILFECPDRKDHEVLFKEEILSLNYYPIGSPKVNRLPDEYSELFGFTNKSHLYKFFDEETNRKEILKDFIKNEILNKNKTLFVLGKSLWDKILPVIYEIITTPFEDYNNWKIKNGRPAPIKYSKDQSVYFTGHPSHGWINKEVISYIKGLEDKKRMNV